MRQHPLGKGWTDGHDGALACPHRDISVCPPCASGDPRVVDVYGAHYFDIDGTVLATLSEMAR